jgi:hypothetical protein
MSSGTTDHKSASWHANQHEFLIKMLWFCVIFCMLGSRPSEIFWAVCNRCFMCLAILASIVTMPTCAVVTRVASRFLQENMHQLGGNNHEPELRIRINNPNDIRTSRSSRAFLLLLLTPGMSPCLSSLLGLGLFCTLTPHFT